VISGYQHLLLSTGTYFFTKKLFSVALLVDPS